MTLLHKVWRRRNSAKDNAPYTGTVRQMCDPVNKWVYLYNVTFPFRCNGTFIVRVK